MKGLKAAAAACGAALLAVAVGLPALDGGFVRDDYLYVATDPLVLEADVPLLEIVATPFAAHSKTPSGLWRPLATASWRADVARGGSVSRPRAFHVQNLAWNALAAATLCLLLVAWGLPVSVAGAAAALFAAHPARSEAVLWISGRSELLMTAFALLATLAVAKAPRALKGPAAAFFAAAAFLSKEQGATLVAICAFAPGLDGETHRAVAAWILGATFLVFVARGFVVGAIGPSGPEAQVLYAVDGVLARVPYGLSFLGRYATLVVFPRRLVNEYDDPRPPLCPVSIAIGAVVAAAILVALARARKAPRLAAAAALFAAPLAPTLNVLYRTGESFAERFLCLPLAGVATAAALLAARAPKVGALALVAAALVAAGRTAERAKDWRSQIGLAEAATRDAPEFGGSWHMLAAARLDESEGPGPTEADLDFAGEAMIRAVAIDPSRTPVLVNLARRRLAEAERNPATDGGRRALSAAVDLGKAAVAAAPKLGEAKVVAARALRLSGRLAEAEALLRLELSERPGSFEATLEIADVLGARGAVDEVAELRRAALAVATERAATGGADVPTFRAIAYLRNALGNPVEAEEALRFARDLAKGPVERAELSLQLADLQGGARLKVGVTKELMAETERVDAAAADEPDPDRRRPFLFASAVLRDGFGDRAGARTKLEEALIGARGAERARILKLLRSY
jgi:protein O-mannosyl-transferase